MVEQERQQQELVASQEVINILFQRLKVETAYLDQLQLLAVDTVEVLIFNIHLIMDMVEMVEVVVVHLDIVMEIQEEVGLELLGKDIMVVQMVQAELVVQDQINQMVDQVYFFIL
jgi:hypothetical protein